MDNQSIDLDDDLECSEAERLLREVMTYFHFSDQRPEVANKIEAYLDRYA